jgi:phage-related tail protein
VPEIIWHLLLVGLMLLKNQQRTDESKLNEFVAKKVFEPLQKRLDKFWENYGSFQEYFHKIDAIKKWEIFRELLRSCIDTDGVIATFLEANKSYQEEVIDLRNKFAHAKAIESEGKIVLKGQYGKKDFEFDEARCIEIRRNLISHKNHIDTLEKFLLKE